MKKQEKFISKEEKKKTGKLKRAIAVGATTLAAVGLCLNQTGALAYLTDYAHVTNKFTEGKVSIRADCRTIYETDSERKTLDGAMSFSSRYKTRALYCNTG